MKSTTKYQPSTRSRYAYQAISERIGDLSYEHARMIAAQLARHLDTVALDTEARQIASEGSAEGKRHYQAEYVKCKRPGCPTCASDGHGPYWYVYWSAAGRRHKRYIGKATDEAAARAKDAARAGSQDSPPAPDGVQLLERISTS